MVFCSDEVPGPLNGTAEHHAEDHPEDLRRGRGGGGEEYTGLKPHLNSSILYGHMHKEKSFAM